MPKRLLLLCWILLGILTHPANAYFVSPPIPLEKLIERSAFIFKGVAESSTPATPSDFQDVGGFQPTETRFRIISVFKGDPHEKQISFLHYDRTTGGFSYEPQYYHFRSGRTYLVFASKDPTDSPHVYRHFSPAHTTVKDQGAFLCADEKPLSSRSVKEAVWTELTGLLRSTSPEEVIYAIEHLATLSSTEEKNYYETPEYPRTEVLELVLPYTDHADPDIARAALRVIGSKSPYLDEGRTEFWLASIGSGVIPGLAHMDPAMQNDTAARHTAHLIALASGNSKDSSRALAILALGLMRDPAIRDTIPRWLADPSPAIRAASTVLLADYPDLATTDRLRALAVDSASEVRSATARSIGFGQYPQHAPILSTLLIDENREVRRLASLSLLSFSPNKEDVTPIFRAQLDNKEFAPLFLLALAREHPAEHLDALADVFANNPRPSNWSGGQIPYYTASEILLRHLKDQPASEFSAGRFDRQLDALEITRNDGAARELYLYALYLNKGLTERAQKLRAKATAEATYDIESQFKAVEANPASYLPSN